MLLDVLALDLDDQLALAQRLFAQALVLGALKWIRGLFGRREVAE